MTEYYCHHIFPLYFLCFLSQNNAVSKTVSLHVLDLEEAAFRSPSDRTLAKYTREAATIALLSIRQDLEKAQAVFLGCDKGNKKGVEHLAKALTWWCEDDCRVKMICLDVDGSGSSSVDVADAIKASMVQKLASTNIAFSGQTTDSGGGGVVESLANELYALGLVKDGSLKDYRVGACTLHAWQKPYENGIWAAFGGDGGIGKRCLSQAVYECYNMQQQLGEMFYDFWYEMNPEYDPNDEDKKIKRVPCPITTQWWHHPTACIHILRNKDGWMKLATRVRDSTKSDVSLNKIAWDAYSLLKEDELWIDAMFLEIFDKQFFYPTFHWLQQHDPIAQTWGYLRELVQAWRGTQQVKGNIKNKAVVCVAEKIYDRYEEGDFSRDTFNSVYESFSETTNKSKEDRQTKLRASFTEAQSKPLNQRQKVTGVSRSPIIDGRVLFKDLVPFEPHSAAVVEEIKARQADYVPPVAKPTRNELRKKLVEVLIASGELVEGDKLSFRPKSPHLVQFLNEQCTFEGQEGVGGASNDVERSSNLFGMETNT